MSALSFLSIGLSMSFAALVLLAWCMRQVDYRQPDIGRLFAAVLALGLVLGVVVGMQVFAAIALLVFIQSTLATLTIRLRSWWHREASAQLRRCDLKHLFQHPDTR